MTSTYTEPLLTYSFFFSDVSRSREQAILSDWDRKPTIVDIKSSCSTIIEETPTKITLIASPEQYTYGDNRAPYGYTLVSAIVEFKITSKQVRECIKKLEYFDSKRTLYKLMSQDGYKWCFQIYEGDFEDTEIKYAKSKEYPKLKIV
uniref:Uncharacterized protein n=1 Tax=viral metagenome TaxID=1070528 RepID=A0A6C0J5K4_9ZZZZ